MSRHHTGKEEETTLSRQDLHDMIAMEKTSNMMVDVYMPKFRLRKGIPPPKLRQADYQMSIVICNQKSRTPRSHG